MATLEIGKTYVLNRDVCTSLGFGFSKGTEITPSKNSDGERILGAVDPEYVQCHAKDKAKALYIHPSWVVEAA